MIKILMGGSPCTYWSIAKKGRETEAEGLGWELFKNYLIAKEKFKPDLFLYENNKSAAQAIKDQIKRELKVGETDARYIEINSALVSAQNRQRFYVHNCGKVEPPKDKGILFYDILESGFPFGMTCNGKSYCLTATYSGAVPYNTLERKQRSMVAEVTNDTNGICVKNGLITLRNKTYNIDLPDGFYSIRKLKIKECCRLQTMPDNYCKSVSAAQAYKCLGNGWTADVIIHILNEALKNVPKDEEIVVLSLYDGIGTGRHCLDKMGFVNVKYFAYEIDKYAIKVAEDNYDDIIELGDAFQVRNDNWTLSDNGR